MFEIVFICLCLAINALLASAETAIIAVSKSAVRERAKQGDIKAVQLLKLRETPERTLSIIQVGITFVGTFAAAIGGAGAEEMIAPWITQNYSLNDYIAELISLIIVVVPITYVSVVIGELVPKTLALRRPLWIATSAAPWLEKISILISPVITLFELSTKKILNLFPQKHTNFEEYAEDGQSVELNGLSKPNRQYVFNIIKIENTSVNEIMINWSEVSYLDYHLTLEEVEKAIITTAHTRFPIVSNNEIVGILNAKELFALTRTESTNWQSIIRPPCNMGKQMPILTALRLLQEKRIHMGIIYDGIKRLGIITMEAIFEEIVGDIYDEADDGTLEQILSSTSFKSKHIFRKN